MRKHAEHLRDEILGKIKEKFEISKEICLTSGGGVDRIVVSAALASPSVFLTQVEEFELAYPGLVDGFKIKPIISVSLVGGLLTERPLLGNEDDFVKAWRDYGIRKATECALINPIFRTNIALLVRIQVAYCGLYDIDCRSKVAQRHFDHLKPLRYILHAS